MTARPWKAAVWRAVPGGRPTGVKRGTFKTAWDAQAWLRRQTEPGLVKKSWHEATLPPDVFGPVKATADPTAGEAAKAQGMARAASGTRQAWAELCDAGIEALAMTGRPFQAVHLLDLGVPEPDHPNQWGPRLAAAALRGLIVPAGYAQSDRATVKRSATRVWVGAASGAQAVGA